MYILIASGLLKFWFLRATIVLIFFSKFRAYLVLKRNDYYYHHNSNRRFPVNFPFAKEKRCLWSFPHIFYSLFRFFFLSFSLFLSLSLPLYSFSLFVTLQTDNNHIYFFPPSVDNNSECHKKSLSKLLISFSQHVTAVFIFQFHLLPNLHLVFLLFLYPLTYLSFFLYFLLFPLLFI